jgi:hypothetical protein
MPASTPQYSPDSVVRVGLYSGEVVSAKITTIHVESAGKKIRIVFGNKTAKINPDQIIEVLNSSGSVLFCPS